MKRNKSNKIENQRREENQREEEKQISSRGMAMIRSVTNCDNEEFADEFLNEENSRRRPEDKKSKESKHVNSPVE